MGKKKLRCMIRALRLQLRDLRNVVRVQSDRLSDADAQLERRVTASEIRHRALALDVTMLTAGAQTEMPLLAERIEDLERYQLEDGQRLHNLEARDLVMGAELAEAAPSFRLEGDDADALRDNISELAEYACAPEQLPWIDDPETNHLERCSACGLRYRAVWRAPDKLWQVIGYGDTGAHMCPTCFDRRARQAGFELYWECAVERYPTQEPGGHSFLTREETGHDVLH